MGVFSEAPYFHDLLQLPELGFLLKPLVGENAVALQHPDSPKKIGLNRYVEDVFFFLKKTSETPTGLSGT